MLEQLKVPTLSYVALYASSGYNLIRGSVCSCRKRFMAMNIAVVIYVLFSIVQSTPLRCSPDVYIHERSTRSAIVDHKDKLAMVYNKYDGPDVSSVSSYHTLLYEHSCFPDRDEALCADPANNSVFFASSTQIGNADTVHSGYYAVTSFDIDIAWSNIVIHCDVAYNVLYPQILHDRLFKDILHDSHLTAQYGQRYVYDYLREAFTDIYVSQCSRNDDNVNLDLCFSTALMDSVDIYSTLCTPPPYDPPFD